MTVFYPSSIWPYQQKPDREDFVTVLYDDTRTGGYTKILKVEGLEGQNIPLFEHARGTPAAERTKPFGTSICMSGETLLEYIDDNGDPVSTLSLTPSNRHVPIASPTKRQRGRYLADTVNYCFKFGFPVIGLRVTAIDASQKDGTTLAGENFSFPGNPNIVICVWGGSFSYASQTYDAPYVFYGTAPQGETPLAVTDCQWLQWQTVPI